MKERKNSKQRQTRASKEANAMVDEMRAGT